MAQLEDLTESVYDTDVPNSTEIMYEDDYALLQEYTEDTRFPIIDPSNDPDFVYYDYDLDAEI